MTRTMLSRRHLLQMSAVGLIEVALPRVSFAARGVQARRIITIGADITEIFALLDGLGRLVGIDNGSNRPVDVAKVKSVGFFRSLSAEGIIALRPDIIIATDMFGPPTAVAQLAAAGVRIETLREPETIEGIRAKIGRIAALIAREHEGKALIGRVDAAFGDLSRRLSGISRRPKVLVTVAFSNGTVHAAGNIPSMNAAIALAGGENAGIAWNTVKPISGEVLTATPPALFLITPEIWARAGGAEGFLKMVNLQGNPEITPEHVMPIDAGPFFLFGPSTPEIARDIAARLHPERFNAAVEKGDADYRTE
jgi:iron complex transport system substrate-binding protein